MCGNACDVVKSTVGMALQTQLVVRERTAGCVFGMGIMTVQASQDACLGMAALIERIGVRLMATCTKPIHIFGSVYKKTVSPADARMKRPRAMAGFTADGFVAAVEKLSLIFRNAPIVT